MSKFVWRLGTIMMQIWQNANSGGKQNARKKNYRKIDSDISNMLLENENINSLKPREPKYVQTATIEKEKIEEKTIRRY